MISGRGAVDSVSYRTVSGWAWDSDRPEARLYVWIQVNGRLAGLALAEHYRVDLRDAGIGDGCHGFEFHIPESFGEIFEVSALFDDLCTPIPASNPRPIDMESNRSLPHEWRSGSALAYPSFFLLGAAKSGTSSLHVYLSQHPDICMSTPKEPFFFEAEYERGPTYYWNRYFAHWRGEHHVGEARHRNLLLPYVPARIYSYNPSARLLAILRNPVERLVSHWWYWYSRGQEDLGLSEAVAADLRRIRTGMSYATPLEQSYYVRTLEADGKGIYRTYVDTGYYAVQLRRYIDLFGSDRLHVLLLDDLSNSPQTSIEGILKFLRADTSPAASINYEPVNQSNAGALEHVKDEVREFLVEHYRPHNDDLETLLGRSLEAWNHPFST